ncbi:hypothetical protein PENDEC_c023G06202 [Penicillium decumbens]|uniref:Uncharacterized protein n=1 Tax=Penicillium decumbens TaxID=69771 RepID=A0A1V6P0W6_PENDC|nr:hypothetical protein PENDEC_c023G06202 [Penicillium decumbens]
MAEVNQDFLSPKNLIRDNQLVLDGALLSNSTKFAVQCLNLPWSLEGMKAQGGISDAEYNQTADILLQLHKGFLRLFEIADDFRNTLHVLDRACQQTLEFADKAQSKFSKLFELFRQLRDSPTSEVKTELHALNMELIIAANNAARSSGMVSFGTFVNDLSEVGVYMRETYHKLTLRMKDPKVKNIIEKLLGTRGRLPSLEGFLAWLDRINDQSNKAIKDLEHLRGSWEMIAADSASLEDFLYHPHSEPSNRFMQVKLAHLLSGWKVVKEKVIEFNRVHLQSALKEVDGAPRR